jgi:hypothetical protein
MKINLVNLIDISLVLLLTYIIIFRGNMPELCFKAFIVGIVSYHFISKYYKIGEFYVNLGIPRQYAIVGKIINGKKVNLGTKKKDKKTEKFINTISESIREPEIYTDTVSEF